MTDERAEQAGLEQSTTVGSSLQAILHRAGGDMETIGVPLPLPDVVVRVHEHPAAGSHGAATSGGPAHPTYEDLFFRRVRTSDSVVRYYEHTPSGAADSQSRKPTPRLCSACRQRSASYFVRTARMDAPLTADTQALCASCYAGPAH